MTEPLIERIAADLETTLRKVTVSNGYHQDVALVARPTRLGGVALQDRLVLLGQGEPTEAEAPDGFKAWLQPWPTLLVSRPSEKDATPADTLVNRFRCDVEKALMEDPTRGGLALDTIIEPYENVVNDSGVLEGVVVHAVVFYRHRTGDPAVAE
jgi:hypothetical protein